MNVYDFDGTLYRGDSTRDFLMWCVQRYPRVALALPRAGIAAFACLGLHMIDKTRFKAALYRFLVQVPDVEREVERFWVVHEQLIEGPCSPQPGDLVISAGPEFLLRDVCERRGLTLIASLVDPHTGHVLGPNCSGAEKVVRFREQMGSEPVECFYSDSHNDDPMAKEAREAFMVDIPAGKMSPWEHPASS